MSAENLEIVRTYYEVWNAGDMDGVRELYDRDAVMEVAPDWPEPGPFVGREWTNVFTIRDGRFVKVQYFWDHAEALKAGGVSE
jgi:ketosteroid isomerase-like protein